MQLAQMEKLKKVLFYSSKNIINIIKIIIIYHCSNILYTIIKLDLFKNNTNIIYKFESNLVFV